MRGDKKRDGGFQKFFPASWNFIMLIRTLPLPLSALSAFLFIKTTAMFQFSYVCEHILGRKVHCFRHLLQFGSALSFPYWGEPCFMQSREIYQAG